MEKVNVSSKVKIPQLSIHYQIFVFSLTSINILRCVLKVCFLFCNEWHVTVDTIPNYPECSRNWHLAVNIAVKKNVCYNV